MFKHTNILTLGLIASTGLFCANLVAWEDHPDIQDHSETDMLFKLAQIQTGAEQYEKELAEKGETNEKDTDPKLCFLEMRIRMGRSP